MRLVILETPYAGDIIKNTYFARCCLRDCLARGEAPIASHLLYTQPGVLEDDRPEERALGIAAGIEWYRVAEACVVYNNLGISKGMWEGIKRALDRNIPIEYRLLKV